MGRIAKCMYISRSLYHTAVSKPWPQSFRTEFQRFSQSGGKPVIYSFMPKGLSDGLLHRGAYGLYFAGIFISLYGVYLMMNDKTKKCSHWLFINILVNVLQCCISLVVTWCVLLQVDFPVGHYYREDLPPSVDCSSHLQVRLQLVQGVPLFL